MREQGRKSQTEVRRLLGRSAAILMLLLSNTAAYAGDIEITRASSTVVNEMFVIDADVTFEFSEDAMQALHSGVALFIDMDVRIHRHRRYLWNPRVLVLSRRYKIERHALTDRFVISDLVTGERRTHESVDAAIADLGALRDVPIAELAELGQSNRYIVALRARLDLESLPAPLRPIAYISPSWRMSSGWYKWTLTR